MILQPNKTKRPSFTPTLISFPNSVNNEPHLQHFLRTLLTPTYSDERNKPNNWHIAGQWPVLTASGQVDTCSVYNQNLLLVEGLEFATLTRAATSQGVRFSISIYT